MRIDQRVRASTDADRTGRWNDRNRGRAVSRVGWIVAGTVAAGAIVAAVWIVRVTGQDLADESAPQSQHAQHAPVARSPVASPWRPSPTEPAIAPPSPPPPPPAIERAGVDPRKPGYNARLLFELTEFDAVTVFEAEPRDETWAPKREHDLVELALPEIQVADAGAHVEIECHTATCRVRVRARNPLVTRESGPYPLTCLSSYTAPIWGDDPSPGGESETDYYLVFGEDVRDRAGMLDRVDGTCARYRDAWRRRAISASR